MLLTSANVRRETSNIPVIQSVPVKRLHHEVSSDEQNSNFDRSFRLQQCQLGMSDCVHASLGAGIEYVQYMRSHTPTEMSTAVHSGRMLHIPIHYVHNWQALSTNTYIYIHIHTCTYTYTYTYHIHIHIHIRIHQPICVCMSYKCCNVLRMHDHAHVCTQACYLHTVRIRLCNGILLIMLYKSDILCCCGCAYMSRAAYRHGPCV